MAFWSRSSSTTLSILGSSIVSISGPKLKLRVVAELDLRADLDGRLEDERLALLRLDDLDVGVGQRHDVLLDDGLAVRVLDEVLDGLVEDAPGPRTRSRIGRGALPGRKPGDPRAARQAPDGVVDGAVEPVGGELDLERRVDLGRGWR